MILLSHEMTSSVTHVKKGAIKIDPKDTKKIMIPDLTLAFNLNGFLEKIFEEKRMSIILSIIITPIDITSRLSTLTLEANPDLDNDYFPDETLKALETFVEVDFNNIVNCITKSVELTLEKKPHTVIAKGEVNTDPILHAIECDNGASKELINLLLTSKNCAGVEYRLSNSVFSIPSKTRFVKHQMASTEETISGNVRFHKIGYDKKAKTIGEFNLDFIFEDKHLLLLNELFIKNRYATAYLKQDVRSKVWKLIKVVPLPKNQTEFEYMD